MGDAELIVVENSKDVHNVMCARCAPAIRAACWACRPTGTRAANIAPASCASRVRCSRSSARSCLTRWTLRTHDLNADMRYLVLPMRPAGTEKMNEEQLASLVSRDCMIGVSLPRQA